MEDANGFIVDVSQVDTLPHENRDLMSIRINVDDSSCTSSYTAYVNHWLFCENCVGYERC